MTTYLLTVNQSFEEAVRIGRAAMGRHPCDTTLANNVAYAFAMLGRANDARRVLPTSDRPMLKATAALIDIAAGAISEGIAGYEEAAVLAEQDGERVLAALIRLHLALALTRFGHSESIPRIDFPEEARDDPRFQFVVDAGRSIGADLNSVICPA